MVYFSAQTINEAFDEIKGNVENKLFGLLGIMRSLNTDCIISNMTYRISDGCLAEWLDSEFYLSEYTGSYGDSDIYVKFSSLWYSYVKERYIKKTISVYSLIVFLYKFEGFSKEPTPFELLVKFCKDYHLSQEIVEDWFSLDEVNLVFNDDKLSLPSCKSLFGITNNTISLEKPYSVSARAGELTRAPFFQTLYAGMDGIKCLLILRENIDKYYFAQSKTNFNKIQRSSSSSYFLPYLAALRTKPFLLLAGISGTGKSRIVRKLAQATVTYELQKKYNKEYKSESFTEDRWKLHSPANFQLIQVKPNWHNSMDVVGYFSNIPAPHYVFTPFVEFIVRAWQNPDVPFFLCLDEMNLAPVEEYFAEFLSAIESRGFEEENGKRVYMTDPIIKPFEEFGSPIAGDMVHILESDIRESLKDKVEKHFRFKGLTLPANLMVIGTVNMDETTFSFSRKVLDRAMSIEMNEVNYDSFLQDTTDDELKAIVADFEEGKFGEGVSLNHLLVNRPIEAKEIRDELGDDAPFAIDYLKKVNALLEGTPFKLGYRAANEALIYLLASREFGQTDRMAALDRFTLMKILSRIEGDEAKLRITDTPADTERLTKSGVNVEEATKFGELNVLTALRSLITSIFGAKNQKPEESTDNEDGMKEVESNAEDTARTNDSWLSVKKIDSMISQLSRDHFVTYWS